MTVVCPVADTVNVELALVPEVARFDGVTLNVMVDGVVVVAVPLAGERLMV